MKESIVTKIDEIFAPWQNGVCPGGQVLIRRRGETVYERCFGYADMESSILINKDTVFHAASVSKQFTVMAVMLLSREGLIDLDADIRNYVSEYVSFDAKVSVRDLMNNDSGIRDYFDLQDLNGVDNDDITTQEYVMRLCARQKDVNFVPRTRFSYSNTNFSLLALIAEKVTGKSFAHLAEERIFRPLGMTNTVVCDKYWKRIPNKAKSYMDNGTEYFYDPLNYSLYGGTSLNTTARDLAKWMSNYRDCIICDKSVVDEMTAVPVLENNAPTTYACGLWAGQLEGHGYLMHVGEDAGFRTVTMRFSDDDIDVIILSNTQNVATGPAAWKIMRTILDMPQKEAPELEVCEEPSLAEAAGFYYAEQGATLVKVVERDGKLFRSEKYGLSPLTHVKGNLYKQGRLETYLLLGTRKAAYRDPEDNVTLIKADDSKLSAEETRGVSGRYYGDEVEAFYTITEENGELYIEHLRRGKTRLHKIGENKFAAEYPRSTFLKFVYNGEGEVTGLDISGSRIARIPFVKCR